MPGGEDFIADGIAVLSATKSGFDGCAIISELLDVVASCPGAQVGDQRWSAAKQDQRGAERQRADHLGRHHRHSAYGTLE